MSEKIACKYCLLPGETGISFAKGNIFDNSDDFYEHLEMEHDLIVRRDGETDAQAIERVRSKNPRQGSEDCQCPSCLQKREPAKRAMFDALVDIERARLNGGKK